MNSETHSDVLGSDVDFDGHVNYRRMHDSDSIQSDDLNYSSDGTEHSEVEDESLLNTSSKLSLNECVSNEVLSKQRIIVQNFYNVLGDKAQFHRVRVEFVQNKADHPQIHANTGILNNACHDILLISDQAVKTWMVKAKVNCDYPMRDSLQQYDRSKAYTSALYDSLLGAPRSVKVKLEEQNPSSRNISCSK